VEIPCSFADSGLEILSCQRVDIGRVEDFNSGINSRQVEEDKDGEIMLLWSQELHEMVAKVPVLNKRY
jgi:hypothetical protein